MQVVEAIADARVSDPAGRPAYVLAAGQRYVLYDCEMEAGICGGAVKHVCPLDELLPRYEGERLATQRLFVPCIGGLGDTVVLGTCLAALKRTYPGVAIDVPCPALHHGLLTLIDLKWTPRTYPLPGPALTDYAFYLCLEDVERFAHQRRLCNADIFARCLRTPPPDEPVTLRLPQDLLKQWDLGTTECPRIGIAIARPASMKAYPIDLVLELARSLLKRGAAVLLFGLSREIRHELPHAPPMLCNLVDRTPTVESLAAVLSQLDGAVCCDSLVLHLAGALRVRALAIHTSSAATASRGYPTVRTITADVPCSPCGVWDNRCPQGHFECVVPRHPDLNPHRLADHVMDMVGGRVTKTARPIGSR